MSKYIIKNCPAIHYCPPCREYHCGESTLMANDKFSMNCVDNNEKLCLLKQVVEKVSRVAYAGHCDNCDGCGYDNGCKDIECGTYQANEILQLIDIEEVDNENSLGNMD